ncbi:hypothetical protein ACT3TI_08130 [Psychrobacter sp. AOP22-C1-22]|uniref:hypothetical protein n=1 Tax=unclassified Psychrobacter TaxID=196806 RepID=UPI001787D63D|nr:MULTISPECIES: hypothetical protein [unclassified Psychrobacter]MBE0406788.1 hypothetical protein [Psychrobacter sp. FME6]MBE0445294.1 hypothetical protein [Psychrobacter sp. FME5]
MNKQLPKEYSPFNKVWVCSNTFNEGEIIFEVEGNPVFLIGRDNESHKTLLWFNAPIKGNNTNRWHNIISKNKVNDVKYELNTTEYGNEVTFLDQPLLQFKIMDDNLVINIINLTPIGLNIYGGLSSLTIVGNTLSGNTFTGVSTMIAIGK